VRFALLSKKKNLKPNVHVALQVLIEKILRSCPEVGRIYILIRRCRKTGRSGQERLDKEVLSSRCFDRLRMVWPGFAGKCQALEGDVQDAYLGMSAADLQTVHAGVSVVFHCAATVKFNEHLTV
jgi:fatty acyl-CoA reductase